MTEEMKEICFHIFATTNRGRLQFFKVAKVPRALEIDDKLNLEVFVHQ